MAKGSVRYSLRALCAFCALYAPLISREPYAQRIGFPWGPRPNSCVGSVLLRAKIWRFFVEHYSFNLKFWQDLIKFRKNFIIWALKFEFFA